MTSTRSTARAAGRTERIGVNALHLAFEFLPLILPSMPTPPWKQKPPAERGAKTTLTPESIAWAKARAQRAGRRYPNLVDNMAAARRQREAGRSDPDASHP